MNSAVILKIGDMHRLRTGKDRIVYAGMPSEDVFSIVQVKWELLYRGFAWTLYFPKAETQIRIDGVNLVVESVGPDAITLRG
jgi:hypothetical protein